MNISIQLAPAIEKHLHDVAGKYNLDVHEYTSEVVQELLAKSIGWSAEGQFDAEHMLNHLAARMQANREQARAVQKERNAAAIALLRSWREEDAKVDEQEKSAREAEGRALEECEASRAVYLCKRVAKRKIRSRL